MAEPGPAGAAANGVEPEGPSAPAFYALRSGGWRDYWTLLHPPYTLWHLSFVAIGAAVAPALVGLHLAAALVGFFLGVGLTAHALDELRGRPLSTRIPDAVLWAIAAAGLAGAVAIGVAGAARVSWWLLAFVGFGAFIVVAYNLESLGGLFHSDLWFALAWGAFPALTGSFAQAGSLSVAAVLVAAACALSSHAQRTLSTPVRRLRRRVRSVRGEVVLADGSREELDAGALRAAPEGALRVLWMAQVLLAAGLVTARLL
ncbi:MAG: hypothetical protein HY658_09620 [Actinobacteria bacterium]|nr:hypothetical protein [Actinomycetota bacterium]